MCRETRVGRCALVIRRWSPLTEKHQDHDHRHNQVILVKGHFYSDLPLCSRDEPVFVAHCSPLAMPENREIVVQVFYHDHDFDADIYFYWSGSDECVHHCPSTWHEDSWAWWQVSDQPWPETSKCNHLSVAKWVLEIEIFIFINFFCFCQWWAPPGVQTAGACWCFLLPPPSPWQHEGTAGQASARWGLAFFFKPFSETLPLQWHFLFQAPL